MARYSKKLYKLVRFEKSSNPTSKYQAILQNKETGKEVKIHFGGIRPNGVPYEQFKDSTGLGLYSQYDHGDKMRKRLYRNRHSNEKKSFKDFWTAGFLSWTYLW